MLQSQNFAVYSDNELADWIRAGYLFPQPFIIMSLNAIVSEINEKYLKSEDKTDSDRRPTIFMGSSQIYETTTGKLVVLSLPRDTNAIIITPPMDNTKDADEYQKMIQIMPGPVIVKLAGDEKTS
jgi:hypothetical protein